MKRGKSLLITSTVGALLALLASSVGASEIGLCPPYFKTFGPDDPSAEIVSAINSASTRPGGATVQLLPGQYELVGIAPVSGVLCVAGKSEPGRPAIEISDVDFTVAIGGILTLRFLAVGRVSVETGGLAQLYSSRLEGADNAGILLLRDTEITGVNTVSLGSVPDLLKNSGYLYADQLAIYDCTISAKYSGSPAILRNEGTASFRNSTIGTIQTVDQAEGILNFGYLEMSGTIVWRMPWAASTTDTSRTLATT